MVRRKATVTKNRPKLGAIVSSTGQRVASLVVGTSALVAAILYFVGLLPVFWPTTPVIDILEDGPENPFLNIFRITNESDLFELEDVQMTCKLNGVKVGRDTWNTSTRTDQTNTIPPKGSITSPCIFPPGFAEGYRQAREGGISIILDYQNPLWFGTNTASKTYYLSTHESKSRWTEDRPVQVMPVGWR